MSETLQKMKRIAVASFKTGYGQAMRDVIENVPLSRPDYITITKLIEEVEYPADLEKAMDAIINDEPTT